LRQAGFTFSQTYVENCVASYPAIVQNLVSLFCARLHPTGQNELTAAELEKTILVQFDQVSNLDDDKILHGLLQVILATCRTSFWQLSNEGQFKNHFAFKLISNAIPFLPQPRPLFEIWVYSPRMEGVHLRGSKVARGGLRWSDRMEDFRTEVLGLVKAQMVKNSVIVPMGSKGGFVCKNAPAPSHRDAFLAEGIACYKLFISALLDLTDNLVNGQVQVPVNVYCRDEVDPYLVVAADKGTATFSDIANGVSADYGFWLDDAFASGGSVGYDHKAMGITARGAWEATQRHFRHLGKNIQTEDFTVIGIGDMAGDVFGNGMLLSEHICLLAAFNHQHIFLDPNPNVANSFAERKRLFQLPRSSWADYNPALISAGGGVFERSAKSIPLSTEVRAWLKTDATEMPPLELIHALLQAEADLLYNGGIGTYIKASDESHADAKDRANDALRVNGNQLRVKVVCEGGNLGCTQKGRIEYALNGGNIYTDAIDNSAGVDCSDHEVNIKILLGSVVQAQQMTTAERNVLLASMTEEVGALVLRNNYLQTQALAFNQHFHAPSMLSTHARMMMKMEKEGFLKLHRDIEFLPNEAQLAARKSARLGLSAPEIAVLMAYNKINLDQALLNTTLPDEADFASILVNYFPKALQTQFESAMSTHHLKREIISNQLANQVINRMGTTFLFRMKEAFPCDEAAICRAWWLANHSLKAEQLWLALEALDNLVAADLQIHGMMMVRTLVERATRWFLTHKRALVSSGVPSSLGLQAYIDEFAPKVEQVMQALPNLILAHQDPEVASIEAEFDVPNMPQNLARLLARLSYAVPVFDIIELADANAVDLLILAQNYYEMGVALQLNWLRVAITDLPRDNRWQSLARSALRDDLYRQHAQLLQAALDEQKGQTNMTQNWLANRAASVALCHGMFSELQSYSGLDLAMLSAGMRELNSHLTTA
ncbi:MAG: NAD-glutamate dehydrogenase, partial [Neisseriaceae bacterium]|nr:NAD-glutamate dehydrogenase [Neisseriaceae bacterium]